MDNQNTIQKLVVRLVLPPCQHDYAIHLKCIHFFMSVFPIRVLRHSCWYYFILLKVENIKMAPNFKRYLFPIPMISYFT